MKHGGQMDEKGLGKRINMARKERGYTADRLSELCSINATYLRQIEGRTKVPSLPVFINICFVFHDIRQVRLKKIASKYMKVAKTTCLELLNRL